MIKLEKNYYNIIPILLIEIIIVYIFEYLVFIYYIIPGSLVITNKYLGSLTQKSYLLFNDDNHDVKISDSIKNENNYISTQNIYSILIFSFTIFGILLLLLLYKYIIVNVFNKSIEWFFVSMTVIGITFFIIIMESIYIFIIENETQNAKNYFEYFLLINKAIENYAISTNFKHIPISTNPKK